MATNPFPGIPAVVSDQNLAPTVRALVEVVEIMMGVRKQGKYAVLTEDNLSDIKNQISALNERVRQLELAP